MAANPTPITKKQKLTAVFPTRSPYIPIALFIILALLLVLLANPLRALYHQQQAGRFLAEVVPVGANDYGGFACLRPFLTDFAQRETLQTALYYLRKAENYAPKQAHTFYLLGKTLCLLGDYENAIQALQTFSDLRPKNPLGYLEMGFALLQACPPNGKCENGLNTYDAWRKAGVRAEDFLALAEKARQKEDYETALLWYQNAQRMGMELRSTIAYIRFLKLDKAGDEEMAIQALHSAVNMDKGWLDEQQRMKAWLQLGAYLNEHNQEKRAEATLKKAISLFGESSSNVPFLSELFRNLGLSQWAQGKKEMAVINLRKAVELNNRNTWAHIHYGKILYLSNPSLANQTDREFDLALELSPQVEIWRNLISFWRLAGDAERAKRLCERAQERGISAELKEECAGR